MLENKLDKKRFKMEQFDKNGFVIKFWSFDASE